MQLSKHIHNMWEPRMRNELKAIIEAGEKGSSRSASKPCVTISRVRNPMGGGLPSIRVSTRPRAPRRALPAAGATADYKTAEPGLCANKKRQSPDDCERPGGGTLETLGHLRMPTTGSSGDMRDWPAAPAQRGCALSVPESFLLPLQEPAR